MCIWITISCWPRKHNSNICSSRSGKIRFRVPRTPLPFSMTPRALWPQPQKTGHTTHTHTTQHSHTHTHTHTHTQPHTHTDTHTPHTHTYTHTHTLRHTLSHTHTHTHTHTTPHTHTDTHTHTHNTLSLTHHTHTTHTPHTHTHTHTHTQRETHTHTHTHRHTQTHRHPHTPHTPHTHTLSPHTHTHTHTHTTHTHTHTQTLTLSHTPHTHTHTHTHTHVRLCVSVFVGQRSPELCTLNHNSQFRHGPRRPSQKCSTEHPRLISSVRLSHYASSAPFTRCELISQFSRTLLLSDRGVQTMTRQKSHHRLRLAGFILPSRRCAAFINFPLRNKKPLESCL